MRFRPLLLITVLAATAVLTACGSSEPTPTTTAPAPAAPSVAPGSPGVLTADEVPADARAPYLAGLTEIDPGLTVNEDRAIRRATNICLDIAQGTDEATVIGNTVQRLSGGNATINEAQAAQVVELARRNICPQ
ncbi:MAG: DUF732 domain-containing protein [Actinomycetota bacterium]|nr:DUF732 domain-containing protein [Actinomycetota bacterium]